MRKPHRLPPPAQSANFVASEKYTPTEGSVVLIDGVECPARRPPAANDRHNAERLADLPWMTWPATPSACSEVLKTIDARLGDSGLHHETVRFWTSLRAYIVALQRRLTPVAA